MQLNKMFILICILSFISIGCETARGMKKDMTNLVTGSYEEDGWAKKVDSWMRENMW